MPTMDPTSMARLYRVFGQKVRAARTRQDLQLSQEAVSREIGLSRTSVTNIERGHQHISLHTLYELSDVLGVDVATLLPTRAELAQKSSLSQRLEEAQLPADVGEWIESMVSKGGDGK